MPHQLGRGRRAVAAATAAVLTLALALSGCTAAEPESLPSVPVSSAGPPPAAESPAPDQPGRFLARSEPTSIEIPRIGAKSTLVPVGLNQDGTLAVPPVTQPMQAAWYQQSPTPGERGPSVLLGHVDGGGKSGIFHQLRTLAPGDKVLVTRADGSTATFVIQKVEQVGKDAFPTERVYGDTDGAEIRLITCGGSFDKGSGNYRDNIIAFGTLSLP